MGKICLLRSSCRFPKPRRGIYEWQVTNHTSPCKFVVGAKDGVVLLQDIRPSHPRQGLVHIQLTHSLAPMCRDTRTPRYHCQRQDDFWRKAATPPKRSASLCIDDEGGIHVQCHVGEIEIEIRIGFELSGGEVLVSGRHAVDFQGDCQKAVVALIVQFVDHSVVGSQPRAAVKKAAMQ